MFKIVTSQYLSDLQLDCKNLQRTIDGHRAKIGMLESMIQTREKRIEDLMQEVRDANEMTEAVKLDKDTALRDRSLLIDLKNKETKRLQDQLARQEKSYSKSLDALDARHREEMSEITTELEAKDERIHELEKIITDATICVGNVTHIKTTPA